jgi:hypothetical protein
MEGGEGAEFGVVDAVLRCFVGLGCDVTGVFLGWRDFPWWGLDGDC